MKLLKITAYAVLVLVMLAVAGLGVTLLIDQRNTSYLRIAGNEPFQTDSYLITNVQVVPMTADTVLTGLSVRVKNGRIEAVGSGLNAQGLVVVDGQGQYLSPGLIDMHVHVWDRYELGLYLANGVTTIRGMWGLPFHLRIKKEIAAGELLAPTFYAGSPKLTGPDDVGVDKVQIESPAHARQLVSHYKAQGYDFIKAYAGLPQNIYDALLEQSAAEHLSVAAHPSFEVDYSYHFQPGFESIEHTEEIVQQPLHFEMDSTMLDEVISLYAQHGVPHTPTLSIFQNIIDIMEMGEGVLTSEAASYMNAAFVAVGSMEDYNRWTSQLYYQPETLDRIKKQHEWHLYIVRQLHEAGVTLLCGTDAGIMFASPGFSIHEELSLLQEAGLNAYEALQTATVNPGKASTRYAAMGTVEEGKWADLVLTRENPLHNTAALADPSMVWAKGRMMDRATLQEFKEKASDRPGYVATLLRIAESLW